MSKRQKGSLIIIGGKEKKTEEPAILEEVARHAKNKILVVVAVASSEPELLEKEYHDVFDKLGVRDVKILAIRTRDDAHDPNCVKLLEHAAVVFFTGGDQLRITSQLGDSPIYQRLTELHEHGLVIAGTSAGAAAMPTTMIVGGFQEGTSPLTTLRMAPGLGLIDHAIIDTHFAERGRIRRIIGAVVQNPAYLGIGIGENTAVIIEHETHLRVMGTGEVYIVDGSEMSYSSLADDKVDGALSIFNMRLHVLVDGDRFDRIARCPILDPRTAEQRHSPQDEKPPEPEKEKPST